ncbi:ral guanine nucleotide dissociation stimulator-like 1 isoform X1 [Erpetoichthys calabaricus]|uniref:ral guanine nucleotide dissociation stimulator-like 1 isoform X1 n=1 Tax=Erpetoichthys calabaricus TaxID=27687 RepID=UPI0010A0A87D|nr:ral guanine nucleotide dissociation stimulator-like 1 isoform X1 [Erpetoichthys calabaricus]
MAWWPTQSATQDWGEEVEEGAIYNVTLRRVHIQQAANKGARWLAGDAERLPPGHMVNQQDTHKIRIIKAGTLERLVETLLTSPGDNDSIYASVFLSTYRSFASIAQVLHLLLDRYGGQEDDHGDPSQALVHSAISCVLRTWLDQYTEDFSEPPDHPNLHRVLKYLQRALPGSDTERHAQALLEQLRRAESGQGHAEVLYTSDADKVDAETPLDFMSIPEELVAEQLTWMDAELFRKVLPHHCLGSVWSQRDKEDKKDIVSTIRATISQFNAVTNCVVATVLQGKDLKPQQRARSIEKWICIAQECRIRKNFSSLRAVISALQSNAVYRLKRTWACVARNSMQVFEELSSIFSDHNNHLTSRLLLMREGTSKFANLEGGRREVQRRMQRGQGTMQGTVPYLGTFLTDLTMLDTALPDYVEDGLINFEKRRREFEVIMQIKLLQSACNNYCHRPDRAFLSWFGGLPRWSDKESYLRSCSIEVPPDASPTSLKAPRSMVKRLSLLFLGTDLMTSLSPGRDGTKPMPSNSSGESMDSISLSSCDSSPSDLDLSNVDSAEGPPRKMPSTVPADEPHCDATTVLQSPPSKERRIVRVSVPDSLGNVYKSILLNSQDKTPAVIARAMAKHNLQEEGSEDYELAQAVAEDGELLIPDDANVFYAMKRAASFNLILRPKGSTAISGRPRTQSSCTLPQARQRANLGTP